MTKNSLWLFIAEIMPKSVISYVTKKIMLSENKYVKKAAKAFIFHMSKVDLTDAKEKNYHNYDGPMDLFLRDLDMSTRPIEKSDNILISPVDAKVAELGEITETGLIGVKGNQYPVSELVDCELNAREYIGGSYMVLWLQLKDYHFIHSPVTGDIRYARVIPGALLPVLPEALDKYPNLLSKNERVVTWVNNSVFGEVAVVKVGAASVGSIDTEYDPDLRTDGNSKLTRTETYDNLRVEKGAKLANFRLGSTVVLLLKEGKNKPSVSVGEDVLRGQSLYISE